MSRSAIKSDDNDEQLTSFGVVWVQAANSVGGSVGSRIGSSVGSSGSVGGSPATSPLAVLPQPRRPVLPRALALPRAYFQ